MMKSHYMDQFRYKFYPRRELMVPTNFFKTYAEDVKESTSLVKKPVQLFNTNLYAQMEKEDLNMTHYMIDYSHKKSRMKYYPNEIPEPDTSLSKFPIRYPKETYSFKPKGICPGLKYFL